MTTKSRESSEERGGIVEFRRKLKEAQENADFAYNNVREAEELLTNAKHRHGFYIQKRDRINQQIKELAVKGNCA